MQTARDASGSLWAAILLGIGLMAAIDEIVFHQLLSWHHFYDRSTPRAALVSDGLLHSAELLLLGAGVVLFADLIRRHVIAPARAWAGLFLGLGAFQLFDGLVDHKLLRVHQVRYGVEHLWRYDLAWIGAGVALLVVGLVLLRSARAAERVPPAPTGRPD